MDRSRSPTAVDRALSASSRSGVMSGTSSGGSWKLPCQPRWSFAAVSSGVVLTLDTSPSGLLRRVGGIPAGFGREGKDSDSRPGNDGGGCREGDAASGGLSVRDCEGQSRRHVISGRTWVFDPLGCAVSRLRGHRRDPFGVCQRGIMFCGATKRIFALRRRRPERDCPLHAANDAATLRLLTRGYRGVSPAHGSLRTRVFPRTRGGVLCVPREDGPETEKSCN